MANNNIVELIFRAIDAGATSTTRQVGETVKKSVRDMDSAATDLGKSGVILDQFGNKLVDVGQKSIKAADGQEELSKSTKAASGSVKEAGDTAQKTAKQTDDLEKKNHELREAYTLVGAAAGVAFYAITKAISSSVQAHNEQQAAMMGLESVATGMGESFQEVKAAAESLASDGLLTVSEAAAGLKNLLSRGFGLQESIELMNRFKDSSAFGRQSALTFGQAVVGATEGLRQENSMLVDNAGVTKNVAKMWEEWAKQHGRSTDSMSLAEKRLAEYNGIMRETQLQVGDAAKMTQSFAGDQAKLNASTIELQQAFGAALVPVLGVLLDTITPIIRGITTMLKDFPELAAIITTVGTVTLGAITAISALRVAMLTLGPALAVLRTQATLTWGAMLGPIGIIIAALGALGVAIYGVIKANQEAAQSAEDLSKSQQQAATDALGLVKRRMSEQSDFIEAKNREIADIEKEINEKRTKQASDGAKKRYQAEKEAYDKRIELVNKLGDALVEALKRRNEKLQAEEEKGLEDNFELAKESLDKMYDERVEMWEREKESLENALDDQYEALEDALESELKLKQRSLSLQYDERKRSLDAEQRILEKAQKEQLRQFEKGLRDRMDALRDQQREAERAAELEVDTRIKAIRDQIDAIDRQTEEEARSKWIQEQNTKKAELEKTLAVEENEGKRSELKQKIAEVDLEIATEQQEYERDQLKEHLRQQIRQIEEAAKLEKESRDKKYEEERDKLQEQLDAERTAKEEQLEADRGIFNQKYEVLKEWYDNQREELDTWHTDEKDKLDIQRKEAEQILQGELKAKKEQIDAWRKEESGNLDAWHSTEKEKIKSHYDAINDDVALKLEAAKMIQQGHQDEIVQLLEEYYPNWRLAGETMADLLISGLEDRQPDVLAVAEALEAAATIDVPPREIIVDTSSAQANIDALVSKLNALKSEVASAQKAKDDLQKDFEDAQRLQQEINHEKQYGTVTAPGSTAAGSDKPGYGVPAGTYVGVPGIGSTTKQTGNGNLGAGSSTGYDPKAIEALKKAGAPQRLTGGMIPGIDDQPVAMIGHGGEEVVQRPVVEFIRRILPVVSAMPVGSQPGSGFGGSYYQVLITGNQFNRDIDVERAVERVLQRKADNVMRKIR